MTRTFFSCIDRWPRAREFLVMRFLLFFCGISIIGLGVAGPRVLEEKEAMGYLLGAMTLGGGIVISGLFATRWFWHGLLGGGVMALLGFSRGIANLPSLPGYLKERFVEKIVETNPLPILECSVTLICLLLLVGVVKTLLAERQRKALEALEAMESGD
jgi:hypothetical protein